MRRAVISIGALVVIGLPLTALPVVDSTVPRLVRNRPPLQRGAFTLLPLGSIEPEGWLRRQLEIQAKGLTGRLDEFWPDVGAQSGWLGGPGESWERGPYYLDGLLPLAYLLGNDGLIAKANRYVEWTLTHQQPNGWLGPPSNTDWWPNMVMLKVLTQYQEATGDPRVVPALTRYFHHHLEEAGRRPLKDWAIYRWADELLLDCLAVQPHGRSEAADACPNAAQPGHRLAPALRDVRADLEDDHAAARVGRRAEGPSGSRDARARRQQRDGAEDVGDLVAAVRRDRRSRRRPRRTRRARSLSRAAERHVQRRRALRGPRSVGRHRAVRGGRGDVLARAEPRRAGRRAAGRSSGADRLQRAAGHALGRHVVAPVRPAGQSGALQPEPPAMGVERTRGEPVRPRAELRLLHREPAPGMAQTGRQPVDGLARRRPRGGGVRTQPGQRTGRDAACR